MRKILTYIVWALVAAFLVFDVVYAIGMRMPAEHNITRRITLQQPILEVWKTITDFPDQPAWRTNLASMERMPDQNGMPVWREHYRHGPAQTLLTEQSVPPAYLVRTLLDKNAPEQGSWEIQLFPKGANSTEVQITERALIRNPLVRFLAAKLYRYNWIDDYLKMLAAKFHERAAITN